MLTFWGITVAALMYGGAPAVGGAWLFERWRSRRRNRRGKCAACAASWASQGSGEPFLIHGRLVCEPCAVRARRRMPWHLGILAAAVGLTTATIVLIEPDPTALVLLPGGSTLVGVFGAVQWMKWANRKATRRIAEGEFPDLLVTGGEAEEPLAIGAIRSS